MMKVRDMVEMAIKLKMICVEVYEHDQTKLGEIWLQYYKGATAIDGHLSSANFDELWNLDCDSEIKIQTIPVYKKDRGCDKKILRAEPVMAKVYAYKY